MSNFSKERFTKYDEDNYPLHKAILEANKNRILVHHQVGQDNWTAADDWRWGDTITMVGGGFNSKVLYSDRKTCGKYYGGAIPRSQLECNSCEVTHFDFLDIVTKKHVFRMAMETARKLYKEENWHQDVVPEKRVDDVKGGLIRFHYDVIKTNSELLSL